MFARSHLWITVVSHTLTQFASHFSTLRTVLMEASPKHSLLQSHYREYFLVWWVQVCQMVSLWIKRIVYMYFDQNHRCCHHVDLFDSVYEGPSVEPSFSSSAPISGKFAYPSRVFILIGQCCMQRRKACSAQQRASNHKLFNRWTAKTLVRDYILRIVFSFNTNDPVV